jgi:hypothetical protein
MRRALAAIAIGLLVVGCGSDPYPLPSAPGGGGTSPVAVGDTVHTVVIFLEVRPGDRIELLGAEPVGTVGDATVGFSLSRPIIEADGTHLIGSSFEALECAIVTGSTDPAADNTVGIVATLTAHRPGRYEITNVRLRYRLNGGAEQVGEGISVVWAVCAADPAPTSCPTEAS